MHVLSFELKDAHQCNVNLEREEGVGHELQCYAQHNLWTNPKPEPLLSKRVVQVMYMVSAGNLIVGRGIRVRIPP